MEIVYGGASVKSIKLHKHKDLNRSFDRFKPRALYHSKEFDSLDMGHKHSPLPISKKAPLDKIKIQTRQLLPDPKFKLASPPAFQEKPVGLKENDEHVMLKLDAIKEDRRKINTLIQRFIFDRRKGFQRGANRRSMHVQQPTHDPDTVERETLSPRAPLMQPRFPQATIHIFSKEQSVQ